MLRHGSIAASRSLKRTNRPARRDEGWRLWTRCLEEELIMGVDNAKVHNHIQDALDDHAIGALTTRLDKVFEYVNTTRSKKCGNLDLAAADHYLLMRFMTNKFSPAVAGP